MSPRSLLAFGELYRTGGKTADGLPLISAEWIEQSWQPRTQSRFTGDGWGYGGQMLYVLPSLDLTVVMTSDENAPAGRTGHREDLHGLLGKIIAILETEAEPVQPAAPSPEPQARP